MKCPQCSEPFISQADTIVGYWWGFKIPLIQLYHKHCFETLLDKSLSGVAPPASIQRSRLAVQALFNYLLLVAFAAAPFVVILTHAVPLGANLALLLAVMIALLGISVAVHNIVAIREYRALQ